MCLIYSRRLYSHRYSRVFSQLGQIRENVRSQFVFGSLEHCGEYSQKISRDLYNEGFYIRENQKMSRIVTRGYKPDD